jgi:hypothetical protein
MQARISLFESVGCDLWQPPILQIAKIVLNRNFLRVLAHYLESLIVEDKPEVVAVWSPAAEF